MSAISVAFFCPMEAKNFVWENLISFEENSGIGKITDKKGREEGGVSELSVENLICHSAETSLRGSVRRF